MKILLCSTFFFLFIFNANGQVKSKPYSEEVGYVFAKDKMVTIFNWGIDTLNVATFSIDKPEKETKQAYLVKWVNNFLTYNNECWFTGQVGGKTNLFRYQDSVQNIVSFNNSPSISILSRRGEMLYLTEGDKVYNNLIELDLNTFNIRTIGRGGRYAKFSFINGNANFFYKIDEDFRIYEIKDTGAVELVAKDSLWRIGIGGMVQYHNTLLISVYHTDTAYKYGLVSYDISSGKWNWLLRGYQNRLEELSLNQDTLHFGIAYGNNPSWQLYKVALDSTNIKNMEIIPLISQGIEVQAYQKSRFSGTLYGTISQQFGFEPAILQNGKFDVIDINKGSSGSISSYFAYENSTDYVLSATNGNDSFYYWYKINKSSLMAESFAPNELINNHYEYGFSKNRGTLTDQCFVWYNINKGKIYWFEFGKEKQSQPNLSQRDSVDWEVQFYRPANNWLKQHEHNLYLAGLACDGRDNVYLNCWRQLPYVHETTHNYSDSIYEGITTHNLMALDPFGNIKWNYNFGSTKSIISGDDAPLIVDNEGNLIIAGELWQNSLIGTDTIKLDRAALFIAKISPDGNTIWKKTFNHSYWSNSITNLAVDDENNIFLSFEYDDYSFQGISGSLTSQYDPTNGLMKLDKMGNEIWLKNLPTTRLNSVHNLTDILIDRDSRFLYTLTTQSGYNYQSSCKYDNDYNTISKFDLNGNQIWAKEFHSDDLLYASSLEETRYGELEINGFVRGTLESAEFSYSTKQGSGCQETEPYCLWIDAKTGRYIQLKTGLSTFPFGAASNTSLSVYVGAQKGAVVLSSHSNPKELWRTNKSGDPFNFGYNSKVCIGKNAIYVADIASEGTNSNINPYNFSQSVFLKRIGLNHENLDPKYLENSPDKGVFVFPNPTKGLVRYELRSSVNYTKYVLYDISGKEIQIGKFKDRTGVLEFSTTVVNGFYFLKFIGVDSAETIKLYIQK